MKLYATIEAPEQTQKIFVEGNSYFVCSSDHMSEYYGNPEQYIKRVLLRAAQLNKKVVIKR